MYTRLDGILCITGGWFYSEDGVMTKDVYDKLLQRKKINRLRRACKGRTALIEWRSIPSKYQEPIKAKLGDPNKVVPHNPLDRYIERDEQARKYYRDYELPDGLGLPQKRKTEYVAAASVYNAVSKAVRAAKSARSKGGGSHKGIWENALQLVHELPTKDWPHKLPKNLRRFKQKFKAYQEHGYEALIHSGYGNKNPEKIDNESGRWIIATWANQVKRCPSIVQLHAQYNVVALDKGWKHLKSEKTIFDYLQQPHIKVLWYGKRYGDKKAKEKINHQHSTMMPTMRDSIWYSDGTRLNYYYRKINSDGKAVRAACKVYEVMDAYSEVFLGNHISNTENYQDQFFAYKDAIQTAMHKPYQLIFDNQGGHKKLESALFLEKVARLATRTKPYNGKSKTIESAFGRFQSQFLKKDWFFTGQNMTARALESQKHTEMHTANTKSLPSLEEIKKIYAQRRDEWNNAPHPLTGIPRMEMYLSSQNPKSPEVDDLDILEMFGIMRKKPVMLSAYGLTFVEAGQKYTYIVNTDDGKLDAEWHMQNIDRKFHILFDPTDFSYIKLYVEDANGDLRESKIAEIKPVMARGVQEQTEEQMARYHETVEVSEAAIINNDDKIMDIMKEHGTTAEQQGLVTPPLLSLSLSKRKKHQAKTTIGQAMKDESNADPFLEEIAPEDYEEEDDIDIQALLSARM